MLRHLAPRVLASLLSLTLLCTAAGFAGATSLLLRWTAPGNDGTVGTASRYQLFVSPQPITPSNFSRADTISGLPLPKPAGTAQSVVFTPPSLGPELYFAMRAVDKSGNWSPLSNVIAVSATLAAPNELPPTRLSVIVTSSNPVRPGQFVQLQYGLPASADVQVRIFDTMGRQLRGWEEGFHPAGTHFAAWDGRDDSGRLAPGGVYFVSVGALGQSVTTRIVRIG